MSLLPIDRVHGDHLVDRKTVLAIPADAPLIRPSAYMTAGGEPPQSITLRMLEGKPVAEVQAGTRIRLFDAVSGSAVPPIDAFRAEAIARKAWRGSGKPSAKVERIEGEGPEYRGALPAWRVGFSDPDATRVFVAADTGRIVAVRTGTWRLYDFFWGLHIMDWSQHENFNTPWLIGFALGGLALWIGGAVLLYMRWPIKQRRRQRSVTLFKMGGAEGEMQ